MILIRNNDYVLKAQVLYQTTPDDVPVGLDITGWDIYFTVKTKSETGNYGIDDSKDIFQVHIIASSYTNDSGELIDSTLGWYEIPILYSQINLIQKTDNVVFDIFAIDSNTKRHTIYPIETLKVKPSVTME
jgi:hypothetical protein